MSELPATPGARPRIHAGRLLLGLLLAALGGLWLVDALNAATVRWDFALPVGLILVGVAILAAGLAGRSSGGLVLLGIALTVLLVAGTSVRIPFGSGIGDRTYRPVAAQGTMYQLAVGKLTLDLTSAAAPAERSIAISGRVGVGELVVIVPAGVAAEVRGRAGIGQIHVFNESRSGFGVEYSSPRANAVGPIVILNLSIAIGRVEVRRG